MRLLLVEDDFALQTSLAEALRDETYAVDTAGDGADGLFKASQIAYDVIILDVMLPQHDVWTVLDRLRAAGARTPVLMLTARDTAPDRVRDLDLGADDYLIKPFDLDELLARLRALIRRASGGATPRLNFAGVEIDPAARRVTVDGGEIALTAREYSLLEYLAHRAGHVVSRAELYEHLFDEDDDSMSNLLDVHVSNLRKKLGRDLITTRRGHGYSIPSA